ncbi:carboxylesterase/lipase family protein [Glycomyces salinus]|uniref:carboxylesterase/lipase family protein n=1 Tax=Glycomyces salinus TaxID=980294 RepID=UPI0018EA89AE|nr:carboxylesterase family protein [Glycomyces salinus]
MNIETASKRLLGGLTVASIAAASLACGTVEASAEPDTGDTDPTLVTTDKGQVKGTAADGVRSWLGVPYASPPTGDLRWAPPEEAEPWDGVRAADRFGSACAQGESALGMPSVPGVNEDCLNLNVYAPDTGDRDLPVMVWLHGGGNSYGAGSQYDPSRLVTDGEVVVVTVNYRQGLFGSLAHPALDGDDGEVLSGNYGLQDQQTALEWVRANASAFGGNAENVTLFGESGGGYDACAHLASAGSAGLFDKAILQSATCAAAWATGREEGRDIAADLAEELCPEAEDVATCLREAAAADVIAFSDRLGEVQPVVGGPVMPVPTGEAIASGEFNHVPVLHGINSDEMQGYAVTLGVETEEDYLARLEEMFGDLAGAIAAEYPAVEGDDGPTRALGRVLTDAEWSTGLAATREAFGDRVPAFTYELSVSDAPYFTHIPSRPDFEFDAHHMVDCAFLFDTGFFEPIEDEQRPLAELMIESWSEFARTGDPDGEGPWEPYATDEDTMRLSPEGATAIDFEDEHRIGFWRGLRA